jgi:hypothetical protein
LKFDVVHYEFMLETEHLHVHFYQYMPNYIPGYRDRNIDAAGMNHDQNALPLITRVGTVWDNAKQKVVEDRAKR